jgi:hypothetical protein
MTEKVFLAFAGAITVILFATIAICCGIMIGPVVPASLMQAVLRIDRNIVVTVTGALVFWIGYLLVYSKYGEPRISLCVAQHESYKQAVARANKQLVNVWQQYVTRRCATTSVDLTKHKQLSPAKQKRHNTLFVKRKRRDALMLAMRWSGAALMLVGVLVLFHSYGKELGSLLTNNWLLTPLVALPLSMVFSVFTRCTPWVCYYGQILRWREDSKDYEGRCVRVGVFYCKVLLRDGYLHDIHVMRFWLFGVDYPCCANYPDEEP